MSDDEVRSFVTSRIDWVRRKRAMFAAHERDAPRQLVSGETHYLAGRPFRLEVIERDGPAAVLLRDDQTIQLTVRRGSDAATRAAVLERWHRVLLGAEIARLVAAWEPVIDVQVSGWTQRRMKTRWGTCSIGPRRICLNTELVKKSRACLEYVVVHEMVHLLRRRHDDRFKAHMDRFMPDWRLRRASLNDRMTGRTV
ncbi:MAG: M48 family metallopeptidase [Chloroflexota bacterium]|nr:M48 family metallopeptidase [Chloroflexota bacterium]